MHLSLGTAVDLKDLHLTGLLVGRELQTKRAGFRESDGDLRTGHRRL